MKQLRSFAIGSVLFACFVAACSTKVSPAAIAWTDHLPVVGPPAKDAACTVSLTSLDLIRVKIDDSKGCLRVYTDTNEVVGAGYGYENVRRSFDLYAPDGKLIQGDVPNQGGGSGLQPVSFPLAPGRYVVASMCGTTYRKVQVEIRAGVTTEVPDSVLFEAQPVFSP
jgi:hypothetical protein